jgi:hypothetical protein
MRQGSFSQAEYAGKKKQRMSSSISALALPRASFDPEKATSTRARIRAMNEPGPACRWHVTRAVSAVTGAFLATRSEMLLAEINPPVAYSDIDYALKLRRGGLKILWTPQTPDDVQNDSQQPSGHRGPRDFCGSALDMSQPRLRGRREQRNAASPYAKGDWPGLGFERGAPSSLHHHALDPVACSLLGVEVVETSRLDSK